MSVPGPAELLALLRKSARPQEKRELAKAFGIRGDDRIPFKKLLRALEKQGAIVKQEDGGYSLPGALPSVCVIEIADIGIDGEVFAKPVSGMKGEGGKDLPRILVLPDRKGHPSLSPGDRLLARLEREEAAEDGVSYKARAIRRLDTPQGRVIGLIRKQRKGWVLSPADKKAKYDFTIADTDLGGAQDGDLAVGEVQPGRGMKTKTVRILRVIGHEADPRAISVLSAHEMGLREEFPAPVLKESDRLSPPAALQSKDGFWKGREDLRPVPLVTIDGADARDFDDAVFAEKDGDGFRLIVAIADVSWYVRPGTALDREAFARGNSTYFPDRVLPMLPERLSNDLCSLRPAEDRACLAAHMWIDGAGRLKKYKFTRAVMRSVARLTYERVQAARDGKPDAEIAPLMEEVVNPLYAAWQILWQARERRGALDLDLPERKIVIGKNNEMTGVTLRERLDSHKLIEEFMILANVAAASALEDRRAPCVYRIHDSPSPEKLDSVREFIAGLGLSLPKGQTVRPAGLNELLHKASVLPWSHLVSQVVLRAQAQAHYSPENIGHFGLALNRYAHFTSPIRRYADLLVHRSLVRACGLGQGGLEEGEEVRLPELCDHISQAERRSMEAERNANDRFTAAWLSSRTGEEFEGRISGVSRFGLFVDLAGTGADGLVPIRTLPDDYYIHDESQHALIGRGGGLVYRMGATVTVRLVEANGLTGGTLLEITSRGGADLPGLKLRPPAGGGARRKDGRKPPPGRGAGKNRGKGKKPGKSGPRRPRK